MTFKEWLLDNVLETEDDKYDDLEFTMDDLIGDDDLDLDENEIERLWGDYCLYCHDDQLTGTNDLEGFDEPVK